MPLHMGISICAFAHYIVRHFNEFKYKLLTSGLLSFAPLCFALLWFALVGVLDREENVTQNHN